MTRKRGMRRSRYNRCPDCDEKLYSVFVYGDHLNAKRSNFKFCHACQKMFEVVLKPVAARMLESRPG